MLAIAAAAATVFLASSASAQLSGLTSGLSSSCQQSAAGLLAGDFATCANLIGLVSIITAQGSVISPVNVRPPLLFLAGLDQTFVGGKSGLMGAVGMVL